jgi:hypothetical protein
MRNKKWRSSFCLLPRSGRTFLAFSGEGFSGSGIQPGRNMVYSGDVANPRNCEAPFSGSVGNPAYPDGFYRAVAPVRRACEPVSNEDRCMAPLDNISSTSCFCCLYNPAHPPFYRRFLPKVKGVRRNIFADSRHSLAL